ncbi:MAG: phenylacetate-CoA oxygenase subunit PaaC [Albidovulum sp.]|nr:phenylacetate-CoA oxygenase subunit PaaC [Albidovulum sp.]
MNEANNLFAALIELADDHLVLGHRLSEWCGHAPTLEEDLALPNLALDLLGTARQLYASAGEIEGLGRDEDQLAYHRDEREFRNCLLVEQPNGDFAFTVLRQFYFSAFMKEYWRQATASANVLIRGIAGRAANEASYHTRYASEWTIRLGDGTDESRARMHAAIEDLHRYTGELFASSEAVRSCEKANLLPWRATMRDEWTKTSKRVFSEARLSYPECEFFLAGGRQGKHGECLGHMLAEMQYLQRSYPGANW